MKSRRRFIASAAGSIAGLALAPSFANIIIPQQKQRLGVALVGLGYYSKDLLAPALKLTTKCELKGIVTGTPAKAEKWKQTHGLSDKNIFNYQDFDKVANNPDIDVIYVVLPPSMHAEYSIRAARAGKHVWCEKPMAVSVVECQQMIDAARANKVKLSIGYRMHHEPNTQQIMKYARELPFGKIKTVTAQAGYFDPRTDHWKQKKNLGGGVTGDMGVYPLNAVRYCTGLEPVSVTATASTTRPEIYKEVEETMSFKLEFPGGIQADCLASFGKGMNDMQVNCANGWYKLSPFQAYSGINGETSAGVKLNASIPNQQARQMDDDATAILDDTNVMVPGEEGLRDIKVVEAIYRSAASKTTVTI